MADKFIRNGFGQVEPNHLSAQRTAQIYGQLPAASDITLLENGQFVKYDYAKECVDFTGLGEWMMVFNEVKLYDDFWRESYKDFAMVADNYVPGDTTAHIGYPTLKGTMVPRVIKTNVGDIFTTNCLGKAGVKKTDVDSTCDIPTADLATTPVYAVVAKYGNTDYTPGYLYLTTTKPTDATEMIWQVVKVTTMPDGQDAVKLMRIQ